MSMKDIGTTGLIDSGVEHIHDVIVSKVGDLKFSPLLGVGIAQYVRSVGSDGAIIQRVTTNLKYDGAKNIDIRFLNNELNVNVDY